HARTAYETTVVEYHDPTVGHPRVEKSAAIDNRLVDVDIYMHEREGLLCDRGASLRKDALMQVNVATVAEIRSDSLDRCIVEVALAMDILINSDRRHTLKCIEQMNRLTR